MKTIKFAEQFLHPILLGKKTQTRRLITSNEADLGQPIAKYSVGETLSVCYPDGKPTGMTIAILGCQIEVFSEITEEDLIKEGMSRAEYNDFMQTTYDHLGIKLLNKDFLVFAYDFKVASVDNVPY